MLIVLALNYLSSSVWNSKQCEDILCPCISYFTLCPVLSQMSMTAELRAHRPKPRRLGLELVRRPKPSPEGAKANSGGRQWLNPHPRHKPKQTFRVGYPTQTFAPRPRPFGNPNAENRGMRKPPTLERVGGLISLGLALAIHINREREPDQRNADHVPREHTRHYATPFAGWRSTD